MLFDMSASSNSRKIMQLNPEYPKDVTMKSTDGAAVFKTEIAKHGRPDEYTYQWYVNGSAVAGATGATYVRNVSGDKGVHTVWCEVSNKAGTVRTRNATLTVERLPVLDSAYPADVSVTIGRSATFSVTITDDGYPDNYTYQWYVNNNAVSGATGSSYTHRRTIESVGTDLIYCAVSNAVGTVHSRTAYYTATAEYVFSDGIFHNGVTYGWQSNSDIAGCEVTNQLHLYVDGSKKYGAFWTSAIDIRGKNKLIFTVTATDTTGYGDHGTGTARLGITNSANLGGTNMLAEVSFRMDDNFNTREYCVDLTHFTGDVYVKILIDRTNIQYDQDHIYVSAIRLE